MRLHRPVISAGRGAERRTRKPDASGRLRATVRPGRPSQLFWRQTIFQINRQSIQIQGTCATTSLFDSESPVRRQSVGAAGPQACPPTPTPIDQPALYLALPCNLFGDVDGAMDVPSISSATFENHIGPIVDTVMSEALMSYVEVNADLTAACNVLVPPSISVSFSSSMA